MSWGGRTNRERRVLVVEQMGSRPSGFTDGRKSAPSCHPSLRQQDRRSWPGPRHAPSRSPPPTSSARSAQAAAELGKKKKEDGDDVSHLLGDPTALRGKSGRSGESAKRVRSSSEKRRAAQGGRAARWQHAGPPTTVCRCHPQQGEVGAMLLDGIFSPEPAHSKRTYCTSLYHFSPNAQHYGLGPVSLRGILPLGVCRVNWIFF